MNKIISIFFLASIVTLIGCQEDFEVGELSFPPNLISLTPSDNASVPIGEFDIKAIVVDGPSSPLASATLVLKDAADNTIYSVEESLEGTKDSVYIAGETFESSTLGVGDYTLSITVTDTKGQVTTSSTKFTIVNSLYVSNETEMYLAGEFNGWGADVLELVDNYTWEIKEVDLAGGKFKFKNRVDWSNNDWGDGDCDGFVAITTGGGPDTDCGYSGLVNIRFNDETLKYTITPAVTYATNLSGLYLLGTFNQFSGPPDYKFTLTGNNTWELEEIRLKAGDAFKFAETKTFQGKNYGDAENDGVAEEYGANIVIPEGTADAFYKIEFNDNTLAYTMTLVRMPFPDNLYLVGGSTSVGWNAGNAIQFRKLGEGVFEIYAWLDPAGGGFKFLEQTDWPGDWGADPGNAGKIVQEGESNVEVSAVGFYKVNVNYNDLTYGAVLTNWGIVGDATPGGWGADTDMSYAGDYTWEIDVTLAGTGEFKFRANDDWPINLGKDNEGTLRYDGGNIATPGAGEYHIEITLAPTGFTYTVTPL